MEAAKILGYLLETYRETLKVYFTSFYLLIFYFDFIYFFWWTFSFHFLLIPAPNFFAISGTIFWLPFPFRWPRWIWRSGRQEFSTCCKWLWVTWCRNKKQLPAGWCSRNKRNWKNSLSERGSRNHLESRFKDKKV